MDEEVLSELRAAAESLPAPPPEVVGQRDSIHSVYRFSFQPPPTIPPLEFDVVDLFDRKAIPASTPSSSPSSRRSSQIRKRAIISQDSS
ncbi:hypothetical protein [Archangium lansingense]|uniref:Uncharacterized protein n=1 Tax=Archangium lansingense TaxID=2995310 RepID=A0ABT3ZUH1_9BACT|nr:hypothetical protein [Archangium lansinium]MCY1072976.1 hypothetical protein [Archangium lansinium]